MQSPTPAGDNRLRQQSPHILDNKCGVFMPEKNTISAIKGDDDDGGGGGGGGGHD